LVLGDFNEVPYVNVSFVSRAAIYPTEYSLINVLGNRSLDDFRTVHYTIHGLKKKRDNHFHEDADITTADAAESISVHESNE
jgi:hypothetical protein